MIKRKILAVVLPIVGCATVVGSGFSAWYFGQGVDSSAGSITTGVHVTEEIKTDTQNLSINTSTTTISTNQNEGKGAVVLDQGGYKNTSADSGIMFGTTDDTETIDTRTATTSDTGTTYSTKLKWSFKVTYNGQARKADQGTTAYEGLTIGQLYDAGMWIRINASIEIKGDVTKYITFQDADSTGDGLQTMTVTPNTNVSNCDKTLSLGYETIDGSQNQNKLVGDYKVTKEQVGALDTVELTDWTFELALDTAKKENGNYSNSLLKWKDRVGEGETFAGGKPKSTTELNRMRNDLGDSEVPNEVVFTVVAHIEDDPNR